MLTAFTGKISYVMEQLLEERGRAAQDLYLQLYAFTDNFLRSRSFFRGLRSRIYLAGKEVHDYVMDAIEKYLRRPRETTWNKDHPPVGYIKSCIIRTLVGNDLRSAENRLSADIFFVDGKERNTDELDIMLPKVEVDFDERIDRQRITMHVRKAICGDGIAGKIYSAIADLGLKRREIMKVFGMSDSEYNNGIRRLTTIIRSTARYFQLN